MLSALKYKIDIITLDIFEQQFGYLFGLGNANTVQDVAVSLFNRKGLESTIYISRALEHTLRKACPDYLPLLKKGYVVVLKTYRKFSPAISEMPDQLEIQKHLSKTQQFCEYFSVCSALTIGDYFRPSMFFAYIEDESIRVSSNYAFRPGEPNNMRLPRQPHILVKIP
ncbi:MAG: hypothetical protein KGO82_03525 [Bacteroidota bacterium]|nr:hypothetical protein [Bacteroidota bacterium]